MRLRGHNFVSLLFACAIILTTSCSQEEGVGGNSHIKGVLVEKYYNSDFTVFQYEEPAKDDDIFILYGDQLELGDKTTSSYTGSYQFNYLWPGNYQLYYYSDDTTGTSNEKVELIKNITLAKNETLDLGTLYSYKALDWNDGFAKIRGKVILINYRNNGTEYSIYPAQEREVYITYNNAEFYTDRIKTDSEGYFEFNHLLKGKYEIFIYSEDVETGSNKLLTQKASVEITERDQSVVLDDIYIEKN